MDWFVVSLRITFWIIMLRKLRTLFHWKASAPINAEGRLTHVEAMGITLECWEAPILQCSCQRYSRLKPINNFKTLTIDFLRLENGWDTVRVSPVELNISQRCHLALLCFDKMSFSRPALRCSFYATRRLEKNMFLYDWHSLPQVQGLSSKPIKRGWEVDFRKSFLRLSLRSKSSLCRTKWMACFAFLYFSS